MFQRIIKNEWRNLFAEKSFLILSIAFAALLFYGIYSGANWIADKSARSSATNEKQEKELAEKKAQTERGFQGSTEPGNFVPDPRDPYALGMGLQTAILPFHPAAILSLGQADVLNGEAGVTVSTLQRTKADKTGFENPLSFLNGRFDLSFVIVYLVPLFILALSFNALSNEREQGILQLLLSQPVRLKNLVAAKITAQFLLIFALVSVVSFAGIFLAAQNFSASFIFRVLLWILLVAAYSAFWFALAALINSFGFSSASNAVAASAAWLFLVLILPSLLNVLITSVYPVPSRGELISALRSVNLDTRRDGKKLLSEHFQDHPELMPKDGEKAVSDFGLAFVYVQREQKKRVEAVEAQFAGQLARQQNLVGTLRFLSPSIVAQEASNDIAGTGLERYQNFKMQVKNFDAEWADFFIPKIYRMEKLTAADFNRIPRFSYREESDMSVAARVAPGILFLFAATAVLLFAAFKKLSSYELQK